MSSNEVSAASTAAFEFQMKAMGVADMLRELRERGWRVACHNDYMLNGELHTFWLFTYGVWNAKGEAKSDYEALRIVRANIARLEMNHGK